MPSTIPAEHRDNLTPEAAQKQWQEIYRSAGLKQRRNTSREQSINWWSEAGASLEDTEF
jgi:hypothetical protein